MKNILLIEEYINIYKYIFILYFIFLLIKQQTYIDIRNNPRKEDIYYEEKFQNLSKSFKNAKKFLKKCLKGILSNITIIKTRKPRISAIMTFYNNNKTLSRAIRSIQNQNISDIEIILINDFSTDDSLSIAEKIQKNDSRIKIINNKKNMGTLFSRSIGVLSSKGKYIFHLDSDDMFLDEDVFSSIMNISERGGFDLVSFKCIYLSYGNNIFTNYRWENPLNFHYDNKVLFQPELGQYPVKPGKIMGKYRVVENFLWSKCIKTDIYKIALKKIGKERYSRYMRYEEDRAVLYVLFNIAESIKFVGKYGILQIRNRDSMTRRNSKNKKLEIFICKLYFTDIIIDFNKESFENRKLLSYIITNLIYDTYLKYAIEDDFKKKLFISCVQRVLNYKYISDEDKKFIRNGLSSLKFLKFQG